ncbi:YeiH family protein [Rheinheimera sp. MMS21-TC3]|uniref:YeiH family protein n=1 Tax=Rheinheimera sp. MMS21-TC3 TaxID=3072790 RepID=UPI0028C42A62|nr:putative sulfate exporter family transporter [Rheinheimera sp. MMS21-TC3]WNO61532.1 putative sulfate exporter family transporter [Rheinheimera sp. MMS21-TC3]
MPIYSTVKDVRFWLFTVLAMLCLFPIISSPMALIMGFLVATAGLLPQAINIAAMTKALLSISIIGLGFGIHLQQAIAISKQSLPLVVGSIVLTLVLGFMLTKLLKLDQKTGYLIGAGTAICGGSAIAAVAPAINAKAEQMAIALACVFTLNAIALFLFPFIGHILELSQYNFGLWSAIAIHDTSSVVGAASTYGEEALEVATTTKLARALWIVPLALFSSLLFRGETKSIGIPAFIIAYIAAILISYFLPQFSQYYDLIFAASKRTLVLCLFFVGAGISINKMRAAGLKPMMLAIVLWCAIAISSLAYIVLTQ